MRGKLNGEHRFIVVSPTCVVRAFDHLGMGEQTFVFEMLGLLGFHLSHSRLAPTARRIAWKFQCHWSPPHANLQPCRNCAMQQTLEGIGVVALLAKGGMVNEL